MEDNRKTYNAVRHPIAPPLMDKVQGLGPQGNRVQGKSILKPSLRALAKQSSVTTGPFR